jgi:phage tail-like protein
MNPTTPPVPSEPGQPTTPTNDPLLVQPPPPLSQASPPQREGSQRKPQSRDVDPVLSFQFSVQVTTDPFGFGLPFEIPIDGYFSEISGLDVEWETAEYKSTNILGLPHSNFLTMRPVYHPIVLKRGITDSEGFWLWHQLMALGLKPFLKRYVLITMYNRSYEPLVQWSVERAFPTKISGPQIRSDSNDFVIEEMTLTHGGIHRQYLNPAFMLIDIGMQTLLP